MSAVKEIKSNKVNFYKTFFVSLIYLVVGLSMSILGPSLLDLQIAVNATINQISYLLPVRALGYVLGSLSGGFLPKKSNIQWFVILFTAATAVTVALLPWNRYIWTILMNAALSGYFLGILELCETLIIFELLLMLFSSIVLILFGARLEIALWIGTVVMGLGVSSAMYKVI
ncbi:uncharacterized protein B4U79_17917 [Dinothrombium tinctorium]|uniref:Major facilitator superfamily (MFS) profile domain-containing protein n=1 Tax=Dinothrombium tinctorium TaxID=1965070 RepID=A0A443RIM8_9ACAR|nr:uncharacterized protein B4U79_17917 [Dinothrombium tinctorium]